jgi:hypothetical protein
MAVGKKQDGIRTTPHKSMRVGWVVCGLVVIGLAATGWWLMKPHPTETAVTGSTILATAPAAPPQPLNADGAPRSD